MASRLLGSEDIQILAEGSDEQRAAVLERAGLGAMVEGMKSGRYMEQSIILNQLADIVILLRAAGDARKFLLYWVLRFEITNLKAIIRARMSGIPPSEIRHELIDMGFLASLPIDELLRTEDVGELLRRLETTRYADIVRFARSAFETQHRLFELDAALDRRFYQGLVGLAGQLESELGKAFHDLVGLMIDRINLVWLLRFRFVYKLPPSQVYYLLIPSRYRLSSSVLMELAVLERFEQVLAALPQPYRNWLEEAENINEVQATMESRFALSARKVLHSPAHGLSRAFSYLVLREQDMRRVRSVLKGRSIGLHADTIRQALGLVETSPPIAMRMG